MCVSLPMCVTYVRISTYGLFTNFIYPFILWSLCSVLLFVLADFWFSLYIFLSTFIHSVFNRFNCWSLVFVFSYLSMFIIYFFLLFSISHYVCLAVDICLYLFLAIDSSSLAIYTLALFVILRLC